jgi:tetratricopeptide (TPR) repeat protein
MLNIEQAKQELAKAPSSDERSSNEERLRLLLLHSKDFYRQNPKQAEKWAREALKLATKLKNAEGVARAHYRIGCALFQHCQYPAATEEFRTAIKLDPKGGLLEGPMFMLGLALAKQGKYTEALELYDRSLALSREHHTISEIDILSAMGNAALEQGDYPKALEYQYQSLELVERTDDRLRRSVVLSNIGLIFLEVQDVKRADFFFERAYILSKELEDDYGLSSILSNRGMIAQSLNQLNSAITYYVEALGIAQRGSRKDIEAYIEERYGVIELEQSKPNLALSHFHRAKELGEELNLHTIWCASLIGNGRALIEKQQPTKAIPLLEKSLQMCKESGLLAIECECTSALAKAYEASGKLKESVQFFNRFIELNAIVHSQQKQRALVEISARIEIEKADRERARMEQIANDASERAELLRVEAEQRSKELTSLALTLVERNEFLCNLKREIEPVIKSPRKAKSLLEKIDNHVRSDRDWETFEHQFNEIHRDFLKALSAKFRLLTPTELKIAVLIKLNLPTKAIANLLCLSSRTVENHRQALRIKLKLHADANLVSFLTAFGGKK